MNPLRGKSRAGFYSKRLRTLAAFLVLSLYLAPLNVFGVAHILDVHQPLPDIDNRTGSIAPTLDQLNAVTALGAKADWTRFGTLHTMSKPGGYLSTNLTGTPVEAARTWVRNNRSLFRLSDQSVTNLSLVTDVDLKDTTAHVVMFRQSFGSLPVTQGGIIAVAIKDGGVYHAWSSSVGDQAAPPAATLSPLQAWLNAAANVGRSVPAANVLKVSGVTDGWHLLQVTGFSETQRARLVAFPTPGNGVRPAFETIVLDNQGGNTIAYVHFVDAINGNILRRENRVERFFAPETQTFTGTYVDAPAPRACGLRHSYVVPTGKTSIRVVATAAIAANDIVLNLYGPGPLGPVLVGSSDTATSPEVVNYQPTGGVPPGTYQVEVCPFPAPTAPATPPYNYAGTFTTNDTDPNAPPVGVPYPPKWKYYRANPSYSYNALPDTRITGCWESIVTGTPVPGCQLTLKNTASRAPWDLDVRAGASTNTTIGNNAQTAESWGSPLTPSVPYRPVSATRDYNFSFTNNWYTSRCNPTTSFTAAGNMNDIDNATTNLFVAHNRMHDWSYHLGFTEQAFNLQTYNFGNTQPERENDPEIGNVQAGAISGGAPSYLGRDNANQVTLQDGVPGITNMYLWQPIAGAFYAPCTDGDYDMAIIGHEYTHATNGRMVGGPDDGITGAQGGNMNEAWADLSAAEYLLEYNYVPTDNENPFAVGAYATGGLTAGIRSYTLATRADDPANYNPLHYGNLGWDQTGPQAHADSEIWVGVNGRVRRALMDKYNSTHPFSNLTRQRDCADGKFAAEECAGNRRWIQLVYDAYLLQPAATSMLNARDAMLSSDLARFNGANQVELWRAFAQGGMGENAFTTGGDDTAPIPNFESPLEEEATLTFQAKAQDESNADITNAKIYVGQYEARSRQIADTDPATVVGATPASRNNSNVAKLVAGTYDFVVQAPGYGMHRFSRTVAAGENLVMSLSLPTNHASVSKGASVTTTASDAADQAAKNNLIDDTENTGARLGSVAPVAGKSLTVDLAGTAPLLVQSVNVSTLGGPNNAGRFTGVRKFEIKTCNAASANCAVPANFTTIYTSPNDAFPALVPRPNQPYLNLRNFDVPDTMATHIQLNTLSTQCTGHPTFSNPVELDDDPLNNTPCPTSAAGPIVRATEFQVFASAPNIAAAGVPVSAIELGTTNGLTQTLVGGCNPDRGLVRLTAPAPAGGQVVQLSSTNSAASVPATITVPAGQTFAYFFTTTTYTPTLTNGAITANAGGAAVSQPLAVRPIRVRSITLSPSNTVTGAQTVNGTATLECAAPTNITISLASSVPTVATVNTNTLTVASGSLSTTFTANTIPQNKSRATIINATTGGTLTGAKLTVNP